MGMEAEVAPQIGAAHGERTDTRPPARGPQRITAHPQHACAWPASVAPRGVVHSLREPEGAQKHARVRGREQQVDLISCPSAASRRVRYEEPRVVRVVRLVPEGGEQGRGEFLVPEDTDPLAEREVGGHDVRVPLVAVG